MFDKEAVQRGLAYAGIGNQFIQKEFTSDMTADVFDPALQRRRQSGALRLFGKFDYKIVGK